MGCILTLFVRCQESNDPAKPYLAPVAAQVWFSFCMSQGITFLTGTSSQQHMQEDLAVPSIQLAQADVDAIALLLA